MPAYNNYFPVGYQPGTYQSPYQQPTLTSQTSNSTQSGIVWVQGEAGAKAYPVAAGTSMLLMDSEGEQFYIKSTDVSGMPMPLRIFNYKEVVTQTEKTTPKQELDLSNYITRDELENRLNALKTSQGTNFSKKNKREGLLNNE